MKKYQVDVVRATTYLAYIEPKLALDIRFNAAFLKHYEKGFSNSTSQSHDFAKDDEAMTDKIDQIDRIINKISENESHIDN